MISFIRYHLGFWAQIDSLPDWCAVRLEERRFPILDERFTSKYRRYRAVLEDDEVQYYVKKRK